MKSERKFKVGDAILEKGYRDPIYVTQVNEVGYYTTWCSDFGEIEHYTVPFELEDNYELFNEKKKMR